MATARTLYDEQNKAEKTAAQKKLKVGQTCTYTGRIRKFTGQKCTVLGIEDSWGGVFVQFKSGNIAKVTPFSLGLPRPVERRGRGPK